MAEGILKHNLDTSKFEIDSAGTANYHIGKKPDYRSIKIAKENKIDISNLKARQFSKIDFQKFDYIFAMDNSNYYDIISLTGNEKEKDKVSLFMDILFPN